MKERQKKKKGRTWAEAAKTVLEKYPNTPMSHKEILQVIQRERLKEISGTSPLACLNAMLHTNSRGEEGIFYKVPGRMGVYTLKKDISDVVKELSEEGSEESSDNLSDSRSTESLSQEGRRGRWRRRVPSKLQSQPSSPQPRCSSPSVPTSKLISPSQKHSKKALKQALKQQQQRNQRRQGGMPATSSPRLLLKTVADNITAKTASMWDLKQSDRCPASPQNSSSSSSSSTKTDLCHPAGARKITQRSSRLSARQLKRTKCEIDVETPDSILVNTNLRAIINKHTFSVLPPECQQRLLKLLPEVDQQACMDGLLKVTSSALNNEFFTSAAQSWKERLAEGEFTPELQLRMRQEIEKEKKVEHWKETFFENYYGENSGLSYEESKELTEADLNQKPAGPQPPSQHIGPAALVLNDPKGTKDSSQAASAVSAATKRDMKPTASLPQEQPKTQSAQKELGPAAEPMKTRRSQQAEDRKLNRTTLSGPAPPVLAPLAVAPLAVAPLAVAPQAVAPLVAAPPVATPPAATPPVAAPAVERLVRGETGVSEPEKDHQEEVKEENTDPPNSPVRKSSPPKASSEDQPVPVGKSAQEREEFVSVSPVLAGSTESQKRKPPSEAEGEVTPEKRPRMSSVSSLSSVSSVSPPASSISSPSTPTPAASQKVPPLKIPVSRILPVPVSPSQVSPRTPLPTPLGSPGRTGARTLADIKAKAQLARAQRAAAAAAAVMSVSKGAVPGPGPGGGGEQTWPSPSTTPSPTSLLPTTRSPATSNSSQTSTPPSHPLDSSGQLNIGQPLGSNTSRADDKKRGCSDGAISAGAHGSQRTFDSSAVHPTLLPAHGVKGQEIVSSGLTARASSCIPANNPLVTQLLQGKEVPLDQILPKPLAKAEVRVSGLPPTYKGKFSHSAPSGVDEHRSDKQISNQLTIAGRAGVSSEYTRHQRELPDKETQEQILQALMQRKAQQSQPYGGIGPQPSQYTAHQLGHVEEHQHQPRFSVGLLGRKRMLRPAMTGHYLLNVSTYGRGSESSKRLHQSVIPNTSVSNLKRENTECEEGAREEEPARKLLCPAPRVKMEQQGYPVTKSDEVVSFQHCQKVKTEPLPFSCGIEDSTTGLDGSDATTRAKDSGPFPHPHRQHLELCNTNQGNSEPYLVTPHVGIDLGHQRPAAFQSQRTLDNQEAVGSCYSGTISMSVPHAMNHGAAGTGSSAALPEADNSGSVHGSVMSFSVTVTTIPAGHSLDPGNQGEPSPEQSFMEGSGMEDVQSKCYCRLKAMIMCKGCGAFCHDDCIGPSKLCVSCLVVR
ncbi:putative Polycomb group protein ASXL2 [Lampris incognitus]|uniref:putative Polycomb group protein ASXL2 n=1 Tax=Lampris incognitus TaxID=2546036 RepID=UPI0024B5428E|nr:putative Polycomb group protein ASXL2 [Lampris incognitus]